MPDFLLELLTEEIPARMQSAAADQLRLRFGDGIKGKIPGGDLETHVTPRRLILFARGLGAQGSSTEEERRGPRADAPPQAIEGFLRSTGLSREQLEERDTPKGRFLYAVIRAEGRSASAVIAELVPQIVRDFDWPKSMRWGDASASPDAPRWVRPLSSIVALLDETVVPFQAAGIPSGRTTRGHRFMSSGGIEIVSAATYAAQLRDAHVLVDAAERRSIVLDGARAAAAAQGLTLVEDMGLVAENAGLTEWPVPLLGHFDPAFLDVPREVIQLTMRTNQKYFACVDAGGALAPAFVCVANLVAPDGGEAIVAGNRKVLAARLSDAKFFWDQDRAVTLEARLPKLANIVFHEKLGTVADKVERVAKLARWLVESGAVKPALPAPFPEREGLGMGLTQSPPADLAQDPSPTLPVPGRELGRANPTSTPTSDASTPNAVIPANAGIQSATSAIPYGMGPGVRRDDDPSSATSAASTSPASAANATSTPTSDASNPNAVIPAHAGTQSATAAVPYGMGPGVRRDDDLSSATSRLADLAEQAARLCKADLVSATVGEFPEVQGIAGRYLALAEGLPVEVADAIRDHYKPVGQGDDVPTAPVSVAVALADKLDTLVEFFEIKLTPTGSKDPFALRRAAIGVIALALKNNIRLNLLDVIVHRFGVHHAAIVATATVEVGQALRGDYLQASDKLGTLAVRNTALLEFLADRLKVQQREAGIRPDIIDAVFALGGEDDLVRLLARVRALQALIDTEDGANLLAGYKRAANILRIEEAKDGPFDAVVWHGNETAEDTALATATERVAHDAAAAVAAEDFAAAMRSLASLRAPIDAFFTTVMVNDPDPDVRRARLGLLARFRQAAHTVADFGRIDG